IQHTRAFVYLYGGDAAAALVSSSLINATSIITITATAIITPSIPYLIIATAQDKAYLLCCYNHTNNSHKYPPWTTIPNSDLWELDVHRFASSRSPHRWIRTVVSNVPWCLRRNT